MDVPNVTTPKPTMVRFSQHGSFVAAVERSFFDDPTAFLGRLNGLWGEGWAKAIWEDLGEELAEEDCPGVEHVDLPSEGIAITTHDIGHGVIVTVITLPEPNLVPDPYFIALVDPPAHVRWRRMEGDPTPGHRLFSLESINSGDVALSIHEKGQTAYRSYGLWERQLSWPSWRGLAG